MVLTDVKTVLKQIPDEYRGHFYDNDEIAMITGLNVDQLAPVLGAKANSKSWPEIYI